jgi:hypothetical protein
MNDSGITWELLVSGDSEFADTLKRDTGRHWLSSWLAVGSIDAFGADVRARSSASDSIGVNLSSSPSLRPVECARA